MGEVDGDQIVLTLAGFEVLLARIANAVEGMHSLRQREQQRAYARR